MQKVFCLVDTSVLFTESGFHVFSKDFRVKARELSHATWIIPEPVLWERKFQLCEKVRKKIGGTKELFAFLGIEDSALESESIATAADLRIERSLVDVGVQVFNMKLDDVDWSTFTNRAFQKEAPFDGSGKGFKDGIVAECMAQAVKEFSDSNNDLFFILAVNDDGLNEHLVARFNEQENVRIVKDLEALGSIVSARRSEIDLDSLETEANSIFLNSFAMQGLRDRIRAQFPSAFAELPAGAEYRVDGEFLVHKPRFTSKDTDVLYWVSRVIVPWTAFSAKEQIRQLPYTYSLDTVHILPPPAGVLQYPYSFAPVFASGPTGPYEREVFATSFGRNVFDVEWSATLENQTALRNPKIKAINFVETVWT